MCQTCADNETVSLLGLRPPRPLGPAHMCRLSGSSGWEAAAVAQARLHAPMHEQEFVSKPLSQQCGRLPLCTTALL